MKRDIGWELKLCTLKKMAIAVASKTLPKHDGFNMHRGRWKCMMLWDDIELFSGHCHAIVA